MEKRKFKQIVAGCYRKYLIKRRLFYRMDGDDIRWRPLSVFWLMLITLGTFFFVVNVFQINSYDLQPVLLRQHLDLILEEEHKGFLIKTNGCRIPDMEPFDKSIRKFITNDSKPEICNHGLPPLVKSVDYNLYIINSSFVNYSIKEESNLTCCYQPFWRVVPGPTDSDKIVKYSDKCIEFINTIHIKDEFVRVKCDYNNTEIYKEFFSFVQLKNKTSSNNNNDDHLNVLIIGIDSLSRLNLIRTMPKTYAYLKNISAYEFLGYNKVEDNTFPNLVPVFTGLTIKEIEKTCWINNTHFDKCPFIWKDFQNNGYNTAFAEDSGWMGIFNYVKHGFGEQPTDYYWTIFNYIDEKENGNQHSGNVYRCVGTKMVYKKLLDYSNDYVNVMEKNNRPYFGFFWSSSLSHDYLNYARVGDEDYYKFIQEFHTNGYNKNTALIFMSDHGMRFGSIRSTYQGMMEERLPYVYMTLPEKLLQKYPEIDINLRTNSRRLTTHFDLHETLLDLVNYKQLSNKFNVNNQILNETRRAYSLFEKIPDTRTCPTAGIASHWCTCQNSVEVDANSQEVLNIVNFTLSYINNMLSKYEDCVNLTLNNVTNARLHTHSEHMNFQAHDYTITFSTSPSDALFETTIRSDNVTKEYNVIGTISRITLYGNQSHCIPDFQMKLYCYCKDLLDTNELI